VSTLTPDHADGEILAYRLRDAARASGLGMTTLYRLRKAGTLRAVRIRGRVLIPADALRALIAGAAAADDCRSAAVAQMRSTRSWRSLLRLQ